MGIIPNKVGQRSGDHRIQQEWANEGDLRVHETVI